MEFHVKALKGVLRARFLSPTPLVLCHRVNYECNLRCVFCPFWRAKNRAAALGREEICGLIAQASGMGAVMYNVWGTEPLLREDLPELLAHAKENSMLVSLITNGTLLEERLDEISGYLDYLVVSMDGIGETYERIRGVDAYEKVVRGIKSAVETGIKTGINCVLCRHNLGEVEDMILLAQRVGATITFEPVHPLPGVPGYEDIKVAGEGSYVEAVEKIHALKKEGYRIGNSFSYLRLMKSFTPGRNDYTCRVGRFLLMLEPDGRVNIPCSRYGCVGTVRESSLQEIWASPYAEANRERSSGCSECLFSGFVEASLVYDLRPGALLNFFRAIP
jgi:MoaA/NifB/PqqE/SkfB family radical SAM enzyme